jgi:hypothetical protein
MTFTYWLREIAGWILVLGGLYFFMVAWGLLMNRRIFEAAPMTFIGFIVFRGGIHILKVAVAAQAARLLTDAAQPAARKLSRMPTQPIGPTPAKSVLPGPKNTRTTAGAGRG